ncbi:MAG: FtsW/RodA/SpoVE family cell cycle protein [Dinghuibacter sp.]|nr:FtsW/RodA/SpoVE family cell cycle protein [Dinghuibacter sp.]
MSTTSTIQKKSWNPFGQIGNNLIEKTRGDRVIWAIVLVLTLISLLVVYSSTGSLAFKSQKGNGIYLLKQSAFIVFGLVIIYFAHRINYTIYSRIAVILFLVSIPLLLYTLMFGQSVNSASRWIRLPVLNMTFQTSDLAKLALFMYLARQLSKSQDRIKSFRKGFLPVMIPIGIICILIMPANFSTAVLLGLSSLLLCFIGRVRVRHMAIVIGLALIPILAMVIVAKKTYNKETGESSELPAMLNIGRVPTWIKRVQNFMYPNKDAANDDHYQANQAKIAIAKGGIIGLGPGKSEQRNFLPDSFSDFIYVIVIEEYGFIGGAFLVLLYLLFLYRCIRIFRRCPFAFGAFLALGLSFTLVIQALVNMAVAVNLFPVTGVTLPLVSMGGTSFLFTCFSIGIILSVARNVEAQEGEEAAAKLKNTAIEQ